MVHYLRPTPPRVWAFRDGDGTIRAAYTFEASAVMERKEFPDCSGPERAHVTSLPPEAIIYTFHPDDVLRIGDLPPEAEASLVRPKP
jgi:hypothetical protein